MQNFDKLRHAIVTIKVVFRHSPAAGCEVFLAQNARQDVFVGPFPGLVIIVELQIERQEGDRLWPVKAGLVLAEDVLLGAVIYLQNESCRQSIKVNLPRIVINSVKLFEQMSESFRCNVISCLVLVCAGCEQRVPPVKLEPVQFFGKTELGFSGRDNGLSAV